MAQSGNPRNQKNVFGVSVIIQFAQQFRRIAVLAHIKYFGPDFPFQIHSHRGEMMFRSKIDE